MKLFQAKRLLKLSSFLRKIPATQIEMKNFTCGTSFCALGWACQIPAFKKAGLKLAKDGIPEYNRKDFLEAGELFFGLTPSETAILFDPYHLNAVRCYNLSTDKWAVIERIERLAYKHYPQLKERK